MNSQETPLKLLKKITKILRGLKRFAPFLVEDHQPKCNEKQQENCFCHSCERSEFECELSKLKTLLAAIGATGLRCHNCENLKFALNQDNLRVTKYLGNKNCNGQKCKQDFDATELNTISCSDTNFFQNRISNNANNEYQKNCVTAPSVTEVQRMIDQAIDSKLKTLTSFTIAMEQKDQKPFFVNSLVNSTLNSHPNYLPNTITKLNHVPENSGQKNGASNIAPFFDLQNLKNEIRKKNAGLLGACLETITETPIFVFPGQLIPFLPPSQISNFTRIYNHTIKLISLRGVCLTNRWGFSLSANDHRAISHANKNKDINGWEGWALENTTGHRFFLSRNRGTGRDLLAVNDVGKVEITSARNINGFEEFELVWHHNQSEFTVQRVREPRYYLACSQTGTLCTVSQTDFNNWAFWKFS